MKICRRAAIRCSPCLYFSSITVYTYLMEGKIMSYNKTSEWKAGLRDGLPICFGYFAVSFAFGIQAKNAGLSAFQASLMSITNLTSAGQFAALELIIAGAPYYEMALTQFIINLRYCLMSCALSQKFGKNTASGHRLTIAYGVTDEIFGVSICRTGPISPPYSYGLMTVAVPGWTLGTLLGVISGNLLPASIINALGIAIYGMFLAIIIPAAKQEKTVMAVVLSAIFLSTVFRFAPVFKTISPGFQIILITVLVAAAAALLFPVSDEKEQNEAEEVISHEK